MQRNNIQIAHALPSCINCLGVPLLVNPRRACARVTVVVLCVCLSVPALASVETRNQRYPLVSLRLFLDFDSWIFEKNSRSKVMA